MMTKTHSPVRGLIVSMIILILMATAHVLAPSIHGYGQIIRRGLLFLFIAWALLFCAQLFRMVLSLLVARKPSSPLMMSLYTKGLLGTLWASHLRRQFHEAHLRIIFTAWSLVIMVIVVLIFFTGFVEDSELRFLRGEDVLLPQDSLASTSIFNLITDNNNGMQYLRDLVSLVSQFRRLGARVVVAAKPHLVPVDEKAREEQQRLVDSLQNSGVAVVYEDWTILPMLSPRKGTPLGSALLVSARPYSFWTRPLSQQFFRNNSVRWLPSVSDGTNLFANPALAAVSKYRGESDSLRPARLSDRVTYGNISVPVLPSGEAISLWGVRNGSVTLSVAAVRGSNSDTLRFLSRDGSQNSYPQAYAGEVKDKIILIWWRDSGRYPFTNPVDEQLVIIESLLRDRVLTTYERLPLLLATAMVALAALLCYRIHPRIAVPLLVGLALVLFVLSIWALIAHHVLLNMVYASIALVLSAVIFPLVRLSHEAQ